MSDIRQQALLNEYKGNMFEYLTGLMLAKHSSTELDYLNSITSDFNLMLSQQEQFIREYYPSLLEDLPLLASGLKDKILDYLGPVQISMIQLMGKAALAANDKRFDEADILVYSKDTIIPVSIKICKANSYVNTKSGGLKSFVSKYFHHPQEQDALNEKVDNILGQMSFAMYRLADLEPDNNFNNWLEAGLPSLPGQLEGQYRDTYLNGLHQINACIYEVIESIFIKDSRKFTDCLWPLIGHGSKDIIQASTFYQNKNGRYELFDHTVDGHAEVEKAQKNVTIGDHHKEKTSFDILFNDRVLQLRVKAMNKFTSKSYKINCSVKKIPK